MHTRRTRAHAHAHAHARIARTFAQALNNLFVSEEGDREAEEEEEEEASSAAPVLH